MTGSLSQKSAGSGRVEGMVETSSLVGVEEPGETIEIVGDGMLLRVSEAVAGGGSGVGEEHAARSNKRSQPAITAILRFWF